MFVSSFRFKYLPAFCALFLLTLAALFGCRQGGREATQRVAADTLAAYPGELTKIRFLPKWLHQAQFAGVYMAQRQGFYRARGLDVEIQNGGPETPPTQALIAGTTDITQINLSSALTAFEDHRLINLAQVFQKSSTLLVGKRDPRLRRTSDLKGKKIGVWMDESGEMVKLVLKELNIEAETVPVDWTVSLLLSDAVDLLNVMTYNEYHRLLMAGLDPGELTVFSFSNLGYDLPEDGLYTTPAFYTANPQACEAFAQATMEGWIYAFDHPQETVEEVVRILRLNFLPANHPHQAWMLNQIKPLVLARPDGVGKLRKEDFDRVQNLLLKHGLIGQPADFQSFHPHAF